MFRIEFLFDRESVKKMKASTLQALHGEDDAWLPAA